MPGYKWIWQPEGINCDESIFDIQHIADHTTRWPQGEEGSFMATYYHPRNVFVYNSEGKLLTQNIGWGFILPTTYFMQTAYKDAGCEPAELYPRFKLTVLGENDSVPFYYADETLRIKYPDSVNFDAWFNWSCTGNSTWKYFEDPIFNRENIQLGDNPVNTKYFRYADLLLMGAEAAVQTGYPVKATRWINKVRTRARNSGNTGFPKDLAQSEVSLDAVYAERLVELVFEGHQFFYIVRTGRVEKVLKLDALATSEFRIISHPDGIRSALQQFGEQFKGGKNEILPLSQSEVDFSDGLLTQDPGY
jgi:hypothetical protein